MTDSFHVSPGFIDAMPVPAIVHDGDTVLFANPASAVLYRAAGAQDIVGKSIGELFHSERIDLCRERRRQFFGEGKTPPAIDIELKAMDGATFSAEMHVVAVSWNGARAALTMLIDTTARTQAIGRADEIEQRYRQLIDWDPTAIWVHKSGKIVYANRAAAEAFQVASADELLGRESIELLHPEDRAVNFGRRDHLLMEGGRLPFGEFRYVRPNGTEFYGSGSAAAVKWDGQDALLISMRDISDRRQAETALRRSEERFRGFALSSSDWFWETDAMHRFSWFSDNIERVVRFDPSRALGRTRWEFAETAPDGFWDRHIEDLEAHTLIRGFRYPAKDNDGRRIFIEINGIPIFDESGKFTGYRGTAADVSEKVAASETQERLFRAIENVTDAVALYDPEDRLVFCNARFRELGGPLAEMIQPGMSHTDFIRESVARGRLNGITQRQLEDWFRVLHRPNEAIEAQILDRWHQVRQIRLDDGSMLVTLIDVNELKETEFQFRQAQKMEAIGQLTGGVAHDFNNLLAVIQGNLELLGEEYVDDPLVTKRVATSLEAARRGAVLTHGLLAFARKQPLHPREVQINGVITGMIHLLARSIPEIVTLETHLDEELWPVMLDEAGLQNALVNLALNARDAMPDGGKLIFRTKNISRPDGMSESGADIPAGDYVLIAVSDTGIGMSAEVAGKVFEPFFTTKEFGRGSGLGLSMVYGYVSQTGGQIAVESEVGRGTTLTLYFPRCHAAPRDETETERTAPPAQEVGSGELILVVEDDDDVRALLVTQLEGLGYRTVQAADATAALQALDRVEGISLLFTDVVLPRGGNGVTLAQIARTTRPALPVLFSSGYSENLFPESRPIAGDFEVLLKPFGKAELARKVKNALSGGRSDRR